MELILDKERLLELYDYYREALLPIGVIVVCVLLALFLLLPQILSIFGSRAQYDLEKNKLRILNENLSYISALDLTILEQNIQTASLALPAQIDFDSIVGSIYYAAAASGVGVGDFQFNPDSEPQPGAISSITVRLKVLTLPEQSLEFVRQLYKTYPLSSATSIRLNATAKEMTLVYYYKPLLSQISDNFNPIPKLTPEDESILSEISNWKKPEAAVSSPPSSTSSGSLGGSDFPF